MQPQRQEKVRRRCARGIRKTPCLFHPTFCCVVVYLMVPGLCGSVCVYAQWLAPLTASHSFGKYRFVLFWFIFLFLFVWRTVPSICTAAESSSFSLRPKLTEALNIYRPGPIDTFHFCRVFSCIYMLFCPCSHSIVSHWLYVRCTPFRFANIWVSTMKVSATLLNRAPPSLSVISSFVF